MSLADPGETPEPSASIQGDASPADPAALQQFSSFLPTIASAASALPTIPSAANASDEEATGAMQYQFQNLIFCHSHRLLIISLQMSGTRRLTVGK